MELYDELQQKIKQLDASIRQLRKSGTEYAKSEREYKVLLREECLRLRGEGMAIGLIELTVYGIPAVAEARFQRDIAKTVYEANQEAIQATKLIMRLLESQIAREWGQSANL